PAFEQEPPLAVRQEQHDLRPCYRRAEGREERPLSSRELLRPPVAELAGRMVRRRERLRLAAGFEDPRESGSISSRENDSVQAPVAAPPVRVAECERRPARHRDFLELAISRERDPLTVG